MILRRHQVEEAAATIAIERSLRRRPRARITMGLSGVPLRVSVYVGILHREPAFVFGARLQIENAAGEPVGHCVLEAARLSM